ncbi:MAG: D-alanine--D-alanine ligase family protein [Thermodesulfobacteriota bacterium]
MKRGITYDMREEYLAEGFTEEETAEFDRKETIEAIDTTLQDLGHQTDRIGHVRRLMTRLTGGERWDLVFNIAEGLRGFGREALVPALLDAYDIPYTFSDPLVLALTLHKGMAKRVIRDLGIPTADFHVVERLEDLSRVDIRYPLFAKPVAEGTGKGVDARSMITTPSDLGEVVKRLLATYRQPVIVEGFLPGREFTVGIIGTGEDAEALGPMEVLLREQAEPHAYSYVNKERCEELVEYRLVDDAPARQAKEVALAVWRGLGCRDAGRVDIRLDVDGTPNFMEVNPLAGLHPEHSDLPIICTKAGITFRDLIGRIIESARRRLGEDRRSVDKPVFPLAMG